MNVSQLPARVAIPFGEAAGGGYIRTVPVPSQIGITTGAASFTDGFPPTTFTELGSGGAYVNGEDMNGILNYVTSWSTWQAAGGPAVYNSAFATAIGGYPKGAQLASTAWSGKVWFNTVDGNLTDPDGGSAAGWVTVGPEIATVAEVAAGTNATHFLTPLLLYGLADHVADGQTITLPGGWLLKYTNPTINTGSNVTTTAFAWETPFPSGQPPVAYGAIPTQNASSTEHGYATSLQGMNAAGGSLVCDTCQNSSTPITIPGRVIIWAIGR